MCMIAYKPKGVAPSNWKPLLYGFAKNKDGVGISILKDGDTTIHTDKHFQTFREFYKFYRENVTANDTAIVHFRYATHGVKDEGNRHPFPVTAEREHIRLVNYTSDSILAHNGVITKVSKHIPAVNAQFSDTQEFILRLFAPLCDLATTNEDMADLIDAYIGASRLIYLDKTGFVKMWGTWVTDTATGILYSNDNYKTRPYKVSKTKGYTRHGWQYDYDDYPTYGYRSHYPSTGSSNVGTNTSTRFIKSREEQMKLINARKNRSVRRCEICHGTESKDIVLKKVHGVLMCKSCSGHFAGSYATDETFHDNDIPNPYELAKCSGCGCTENDKLLVQAEDFKYYCTDCSDKKNGIVNGKRLPSNTEVGIYHGGV